VTVEEAPTRSRTEACEIPGVRQLRHLTCCVARLHSQCVLALEAVASCWSARCRCGLAGLIEFESWKSEGGQDCEFVESLECSSRGVTGKSLACEYHNGPCPVCQTVTLLSSSPWTAFPVCFLTRF